MTALPHLPVHIRLINMKKFANNQGVAKRLAKLFSPINRKYQNATFSSIK